MNRSRKVIPILTASAVSVLAGCGDRAVDTSGCQVGGNPISVDLMTSYLGFVVEQVNDGAVGRDIADQAMAVLELEGNPLADRVGYIDTPPEAVDLVCTDRGEIYPTQLGSTVLSLVDEIRGFQSSTSAIAP